jgi:hypothetical protein
MFHNLSLYLYYSNCVICILLEYYAAYNVISVLMFRDNL